jgi:Flp pilus assembly protein protease CpaA
VLGWKQLLEAALWTAGCGGLMAAAVIAAGYVRQLWRKARPVQQLVEQPAEGVPAAGSDPARKLSIPYAPAIAAGVWLSLVPKT